MSEDPKYRRERLQRACAVLLQSQFTGGIIKPKDFNDKIREIQMSAENSDDQGLEIALRKFDDLMLELRPDEACFDEGNKRKRKIGQWFMSQISGEPKP